MGASPRRSLPDDNALVMFARKRLPLTDEYHGGPSFTDRFASSGWSAMASDETPACDYLDGGTDP